MLGGFTYKNMFNKSKTASMRKTKSKSKTKRTRKTKSFRIKNFSVFNYYK